MRTFFRVRLKMLFQAQLGRITCLPARCDGDSYARRSAQLTRQSHSQLREPRGVSHFAQVFDGQSVTLLLRVCDRYFRARLIAHASNGNAADWLSSALVSDAPCDREGRLLSAD